MNTTFVSSLALLIPVLALTSSFSLSMEYEKVIGKRDRGDQSKPLQESTTMKEDENPWILSITNSSDLDKHITYVKGRKKTDVRGKPLYKRLMENSEIASLITERFNESVASIFELSRPKSINVILGVIDTARKLHLFDVDQTSKKCIERATKYTLSVDESTKEGKFFTNKKMEESSQGDSVSLYFYYYEKNRMLKIEASSTQDKILNPTIQIEPLPKSDSCFDCFYAFEQKHILLEEKISECLTKALWGRIFSLLMGLAFMTAYWWTFRKVQERAPYST